MKNFRSIKPNVMGFGKYAELFFYFMVDWITFT